MTDPKEAIAKFKDAKIAVVGDIMLDRYTFGEVERVSPEAPIPVVQRRSEKFTLGGAANVAHNLATLGASVSLAGVVGNDRSGEHVLALLKEKHIGAEAILVHGGRPTIEKQRILSGETHQLIRLDIEQIEHLTDEEEEQFYVLAAPVIQRSDAVIFSDYAKGLFSERLTQRLIAFAKAERKIILADFKPKNKSYFRGVDLVSPNLKEAREMTGLYEIEAIGPSIVAELGAHAVVTRGGEGISVFRRGEKAGAVEHHHVPGKKIKVFDVSGAGDTSIAVLALGMVAGLDLAGAAMLANEAGAIVVQKPGTASLTQEELASAFVGDNHVENVKIVPKLWGYEKWIENNEKYCCKILGLNKGYQCSLHYHKNKDEMFLVTSGHVRFELGEEVMHLRAGSFIRVPPNTPHRFAGIEDSLIMEVSTHHEDSDSYRIEESRKMDEG